MYSTIGLEMASQATPQGRRHNRAEAGFELMTKRLPAPCLMLVKIMLELFLGIEILY